jgi:hypothetical protein
MTGLTYVACGALIAIYAYQRFNTPSSNRSSTQRSLFWVSCAGYVLTALILFIVLSMALSHGALRQMLFGGNDKSDLPAPLIATLGMTTMLPAIPLLKQVDAFILKWFLDWGNIPAEVRRQAAEMTPESFTVDEGDIGPLRAEYGDGAYGATLAEHLTAERGDGIHLSRYRLTRVVKLYDRVRRLEKEPRYARFFADVAEDYAALQEQVTTFLRRSAAALSIASQLREHEADASVDDLIRERRELFAETCRFTFRQLALFMAKAVLRSEPTEARIVARLRQAGFLDQQVVQSPVFPINALTLLALGVFLYLAAITVYFSRFSGFHVAGGADPGLGMAFRIAFARLGAVASTVWLMQSFPFFRREAGQPPGYFAYVLCGAIGAGVAAIACVPFHLAATDLAGEFQSDAPIILLSGALCMAVAFCCDDWPTEAEPPAWLRPAEAAGCALWTVLGAALIYYAGLLPILDQMPPGALPLWLTLPSFIGLLVGWCVPHIFRGARRAAAARQAIIGPLPGDLPSRDDTPARRPAPATRAA